MVKNRLSLILLVISFFAVGTPAYAYVDPSGGTLFQMLLPMLAAIWGMWMIFANRLRRTVAGFVRRLRGAEVEEPRG